MTTKQAIKNSIDHWKRMIRWAEKENEDDYTIPYSMYYEIKEEWYSKHCPLCSKFLDKVNLKCPLVNRCCKGGCHPYWYGVNSAVTWVEWLIYAKKLLAVLEKLLIRYSK
jgi:hypothetical protein